MIYRIEDETLYAIADAIRLKRDTVAEINPEDMPLEIGLIGGGGGLVKTFAVTVDIPSDISSNQTIATLPIPDGAFTSPAYSDYYFCTAFPSQPLSGNAEVQWTLSLIGHANSSNLSASHYQYFMNSMSAANSGYGLVLDTINKKSRTMAVKAFASTTRIIKAGTWTLTVYELGIMSNANTDIVPIT